MITGRGGDIANNESLKKRACQWISQRGADDIDFAIRRGRFRGLFCMRTPVEAWLEISPFRPQNDVRTEAHSLIHLFSVMLSVIALALAVHLSTVAPGL